MKRANKVGNRKENKKNKKKSIGQIQLAYGDWWPGPISKCYIQECQPIIANVHNPNRIQFSLFLSVLSCARSLRRPVQTYYISKGKSGEKVQKKRQWQTQTDILMNWTLRFGLEPIAMCDRSIWGLQLKTLNNFVKLSMFIYR